MKIDFQRVRHGRLAKWVRRRCYRALVGREGWPPTFRAPRDSSAVPRGNSPDVYVHLPFCRTICPHCPYDKLPYDPALHREYGKAPVREVTVYLARPDTPAVRTLYFGGGTPTATPDLIETTLAAFRQHFAPSAEVGVEVHLADASPAMLERLRRAGVTRVSLGEETFEPGLLRVLGRWYTPEQAEEAIACVRPSASSASTST